ncbi:MAG: hypothetical protein HWN79_17630 [Candidatus Lokiarchaeota archaeon]|nr:hypothetical protein [Candidatus Lokiarchaeota archaeon]
MYYVHKTKFEISGFGNVEIIDGIATVTDVFLIKQDNHSTETEIEGDALAKALYDHSISGLKGEMKFWWHSHVDMGVFWSSTDMTTINSLTENGWFIHGVFNKKDEHRIAYSNNEPITTFVDKIDLEIDEDMVSDEKFELLIEMDEIDKKIAEVDKKLEERCDLLYNQLVTNKTYYPSWQGNHSYNKKGKMSLAGGNQPGKSLTSMTQAFPPISGTTNTGAAFDFSDPEGASELVLMGYIPEQIEFMQDEMYIYDAQCLIDYENLYGPVARWADDPYMRGML